MNILNENPAPIVLFVYKRPAHTRQTVEALQQNPLAAKSELIIYSDAARHEQDALAVREVRQYVHAISGFKSVTVIEQEKNLGLANSVIAGVTEVVNRYGRVIVLEDDLVTAQGFLDYMNRALEKYRDDRQVMQVSGYMFPVQVHSGTDTFFLPFTTSWGWATWKRAWSVFDADASGYALLKQDAALRKSFDLEGAYPYFEMLEMQQRRKVDSWAIRWWLSVFLQHGLILYPRISKVFNIGFDGTGAHCGDTSVRQMTLVKSIENITFPENIAVDSQVQNRVYQYLSSISSPGLHGKIRKFLKLFKAGD